MSGGIGGGMPAADQPFSDIASTDALGLDALWANSSFDILDTLWTQTETMWPTQ